MYIVISCDNNWIKQTATMLYSLSKHSTTSNHFFFLSWRGEMIPKHNLDFLGKYIGKNDTLQLLCIEKNSVLSSRVQGRWGDSTALRLICPYYLPDYVDKYLYIDGDIIFKKSIEDFYSLLDNNDFIVAGVHENHSEEKRLTKAMSIIKDNIYINLGFYLLNRVRFLKRYQNIDYFIDDIVRIKVPMLYFDQDIINILLDGNKIKCSNQNYMHFPAEKWSAYKGSHLIHYTSVPKPWDSNYKDLFYALQFWKYGKEVYGCWYAFRFVNHVILNRIKYLVSKMKINVISSH